MAFDYWRGEFKIEQIDHIDEGYIETTLYKRDTSDDDWEVVPLPVVYDTEHLDYSG